MGDSITILTADPDNPPSVTGGFEYYQATGLGANVAASFVYTPTTVEIAYAATQATNFIGTGTSAPWQGDPSVWSGGIEPNSTTAVTITNNAPNNTPQEIVVTAPVDPTQINAAHSLIIGGGPGDVSVTVVQTNLSVSTFTRLGENGSLRLDGDSRLVTDTLEIGAGAEFRGGGELIGDVTVGVGPTGVSVFAPEGNLTLAGNYTQNTNGEFAVRLSGPATSNLNDQLSVLGDTSLSGAISIDVSGLDNNEFVSGDTFQIITTEGGLVGEFDSIEILGRNDLYFEIDFAAGAAAAGSSSPDSPLASPSMTSGTDVLASVFFRGDADQDGDIDSFDAEIFAATLLDNTLPFFPQTCGGMSCDIINDFLEVFDFQDTNPGSVRVVDFFDVADFAAALASSGSSSLSEAFEIIDEAFARVQAAQSVPEPSAAWLASFALGGLLLRRRS